MKYDLVISGVGGQGILSIAFVIDNTALKQELHFKQAEVHGMAQRGGAVSSHLRISDQQIHSDIVARQGAQLILSVEPMEALRYLELLAPTGRIVTSTSPECNIPDYPEPAALQQALLTLPGSVLVNGKKVAKEAGSHRAQNMVILGAAAPYLPLEKQIMEHFIEVLFGAKGDKVVQSNLRAFRYGLACGQFFRACLEQGAQAAVVLELMDHLQAATLEAAAAEPWSQILLSPLAAELQTRLLADPERLLPGGVDLPRQLLAQGIDALP